MRYQEALYKQYYSFAMSVCLRYTPTRDDALEVVNDSFMKVFRSIDQYDDTRPFKTWFRRILINASLDQYRSNKRYLSSVDLIADYTDNMIQPEESDFSGDVLDAEDVLKLYGKLPEIYRLVFNLYEIEGYSHDEIAGMLDIAPGTSRSNLSRAKKMLVNLYHTQKNEGVQ